MNEKPILFSGEMVKAILEGRKTQTRRVKKPSLYGYKTFEPSPYGIAGDTLWVRETWRSIQYFDHIKPRNLQSDAVIQYRADKTIRGGGDGTIQKMASVYLYASLGQSDHIEGTFCKDRKVTGYQ